MEILYTNQAVSISELKRNPTAVARQAGHRPVVVLNHNKPAFYLVEPKLFEAMMDQIEDKELLEIARQRLAGKHEVVEVDIADL